MGWVGAAAAVASFALSAYGASQQGENIPPPPVPQPPLPNLGPPAPGSSTSTSTSGGTENTTVPPSLVSPILQQPSNTPNVLNSPAEPFASGDSAGGLIRRKTGGMKVGV
jgi:hypothetical protein